MDDRSLLASVLTLISLQKDAMGGIACSTGTRGVRACMGKVREFEHFKLCHYQTQAPVLTSLLTRPGPQSTDLEISLWSQDTARIDVT